MNALLLQFLGLARRYLLATVCFTLVLILGVTDYFLWQRRAELADQNERIRLEGEAMLLSLNAQARILAQTATIDEALAYISKNLVSEADLAGNLDYFYQIEKNARIRLSNLSQLSSQPSGDEEAYRAIPFSLRLTGPYPQILTFLHELETGPRLLRVKNYRFSQTDPSAADALSLDLTIEMLGRP
jgi:Tfp pilus assembly protein PilO